MTRYIDKNGDILEVILWDGTDDALIEVMELMHNGSRAKSLRVDHGVLYGATGFRAHIGEYIARNRYGACMILTAEQLEETYSFLGVGTIQ